MKRPVKRVLTIDEVIQIVLSALYKKDIFKSTLFLKGGQALRLKEQIQDRFSSDIDFSTPGKIDAPEVFFEKEMRSILYAAFQGEGLYLFDFVWERRPKVLGDGFPDHWGGYGASFKLIEDGKKTLPLEQQRREALQPSGSASRKMQLDFSEYEYCKGAETIQVRSIGVQVYSRSMLVVEKLRAICQQHSGYSLTKLSPRARDYYDIERLWNKVIQEGVDQTFLGECREIIVEVFGAKDVPLGLLDKIFEDGFLGLQKSTWSAVKSSVSGDLQSFDYYVETLKQIVKKIKVGGP